MAASNRSTWSLVVCIADGRLGRPGDTAGEVLRCGCALADSSIGSSGRAVNREQRKRRTGERLRTATGSPRSPMMLHAWMTLRPSARARSTTSSSSAPGFNQTSATPFAQAPRRHAIRTLAERRQSPCRSVQERRAPMRYARWPSISASCGLIGDHGVALLLERAQRLVAELLPFAGGADDRDGLRHVGIVTCRDRGSERDQRQIRDPGSAAM